MLLLLFDTHAGEIMNDYSHLSISPQRRHVHPLKGNRNTRKCYRNHAKKTGGMCFCTWVMMAKILSTAAIRTVRRWEGERGVSPPASAVFEEESRNRDMLTQINRTFPGCYLSVSGVLFTWMRLLCFSLSTSLLYDCCHQCHSISFVLLLVCFLLFSHKSQFNTASSLLSHIWQTWMYSKS